MKKKTLAILITAALLVSSAAGICWWQRDNIAALKTSMSYSREDISQLMDENDRKVSDTSTLVEGVTVRDLTEEEKAALQDESLDREALIEVLIGGGSTETTQDEAPAPESTAPSSPADTTPSAPPASQPEKPAQKPTEQPVANKKDPRREELSRLVAEIYLMKSEYTAWLEAKHTAAIEEFVALPQEQQTTANKYKIGMAYMKEGLAKEDECDAKMAEIQSRIRTLLTELGESTALVDEIQAAYEEEKTLKKAYYLGLHD